MVCKQLPYRALFHALPQSCLLTGLLLRRFCHVLRAARYEGRSISYGIQAGWLRCSTLPQKDIGSGRVVMDARERERPQSRRPSIKRPWEEDPILPEMGNAWLGTTLPPIDPVPYRRPSISRQPEPGGNLHNLYQPNVLDDRDFVAKRVRYEGNNDYIPFSDSKLQSQAPRKSSRHSLWPRKF